MFTSLIVLLAEGEVVIHVWWVSIVEQVRGQLPLQTDGLMGQLANLNEKLLIVRYWKRHCCALCPSPRLCAQHLHEQPSDSNSVTEEVFFVNSGIF